MPRQTERRTHHAALLAGLSHHAALLARLSHHAALLAARGHHGAGDARAAQLLLLRLHHAGLAVLVV